MPNQNSIYKLIQIERDRQDEKWGANRQQHPMTWLTILLEEIGEVAKAILNRDWNNVKEELIQCAAVIFAWLEMIDEGYDMED